MLSYSCWWNANIHQLGRIWTSCKCIKMHKNTFIPISQPYIYEWCVQFPQGLIHLHKWKLTVVSLIAYCFMIGPLTSLMRCNSHAAGRSFSQTNILCLSSHACRSFLGAQWQRTRAEVPLLGAIMLSDYSLFFLDTLLSTWGAISKNLRGNSLPLSLMFHKKATCLLIAVSTYGIGSSGQATESRFHVQTAIPLGVRPYSLWHFTPLFPGCGMRECRFMLRCSYVSALYVQGKGLLTLG